MAETVFRARLIMLRKERHLTQGQIAEKLGVSRPSYTCYELGNTTPNLTTLCKIADLFEVNLDYLMGRSEDPSMDAADPKSAVLEVNLIEKFRKLSPEKRERFLEMLSLISD